MRTRPRGLGVDGSAFRDGPPIWPLVFVACAGLMGGAGVAIAAAGAHGGGGDLTKTAADFLMIHAAVVLAAGVLATLQAGAGVFLKTALALLTVGAVLFSGELALAGLAGWRPVPLAAPTGGFCLIAGWLALTASAVRICLQVRHGSRSPGSDGE